MSISCSASALSNDSMASPSSPRPNWIIAGAEVTRLNTLRKSSSLPSEKVNLTSTTPFQARSQTLPAPNPSPLLVLPCWRIGIINERLRVAGAGRQSDGKNRSFAIDAFRSEIPAHQSAQPPTDRESEPRPAKRFDVEVSAWLKAWKSFPSCSCVIPIPVSETIKTTAGPAT